MDIRRRMLLTRMTHNELGKTGECDRLLPSEVPVGFFHYPRVRRKSINVNGSLYKKLELEEETRKSNSISIENARS
jgi:hypothetical protein